MQVRTADHLGMCFGVRDAIALALDLTQRVPLTILGDLVHNPDVVAQMDSAGAVRVNRPEQIHTPAVLVTAHGVSDHVRDELRERGLQVHDATCPLVTRAHRALARLVAEGRYPVVIGQKEHVEVRGLVGDHPEHSVVLGDSDFDQLAQLLAQRPGLRLGVVAQTTQPLERVLGLVERMRARFPDTDLRFIDTVCQPTKDRQEAVHRLALESDVVIVVGGPESNNSRKLAEMARALGSPAYLVAHASDLQPEWFPPGAVVGLTAGTSTPPEVIAEVQAWLEEFEPAEAAKG
jgi:4-hydroxy-3-methylbut-2-enyl diphosphate reductase